MLNGEQQQRNWVVKKYLKFYVVLSKPFLQIPYPVSIILTWREVFISHFGCHALKCCAIPPPGGCFTTRNADP